MKECKKVIDRDEWKDKNDKKKREMEGRKSEKMTYK